MNPYRMNSADMAELLTYAKHFHMRLGQLLVNITPEHRDLFYMEDEDVMFYARKYFMDHTEARFS